MSKQIYSPAKELRKHNNQFITCSKSLAESFHKIIDQADRVIQFLKSPENSYNVLQY